MTNTARRLALLTLAGSIAISVPASAHHGTGISYIQDQTIQIKGKVTEFSWKNPHSALFIEVTEGPFQGQELCGRAEQPWRHDPAGLDQETVSARRRGRHQRAPVAHGFGRRRVSQLHGHRQRQGDETPLTLSVARKEGAREMRNRVVAACLAGTFALSSVAFAQQKPATAFDSKDLNGIWGRGPAAQESPNQAKADARGMLSDGGLMTEWGPSSPLTPKGLAQVNANKPGKGPRAAPPAFGERSPWRREPARLAARHGVRPALPVDRAPGQGHAALRVDARLARDPHGRQESPRGHRAVLVRLLRSASGKATPWSWRQTASMPGRGWINGAARSATR